MAHGSSLLEKVGGLKAAQEFCPAAAWGRRGGSACLVEVSWVNHGYWELYLPEAFANQ